MNVVVSVFFGVNLPARLLVNDAKSGIKILSSLQEELKNCDEFAISVAFINWGGIPRNL